MTYAAFPPLFSALVTFVLGILVFLRRHTSPVARPFSILCILLVLWNLNFFLLYAVPDRETAFAATRPFRVAINFVSPTVLYVILSLRKHLSSKWLALLIADYVAAFALGIATALDLVVSNLQPSTYGYASVGGPLYNLFSISVIANFLLASAVLIGDYLTSSDPRTRLQLKFWCLGAALAFPLGLTNLLPAYGIRFYPLGSLGNAAWAAIVAYAVIRHRLMDIDVVVTKTVAYFVVVLSLVVPSFVSILWLQMESFGQLHSDFSLVTLFLLLGVGSLFPVVRSVAESRIERSLFPTKHEYRIALGAFVRSIVKILDRDRLIRELLETLTRLMNLETAAVMLRSENGSAFEVNAFSGHRPVAESLPASHPLVQLVESCHHALIREELRSGGTKDFIATDTLLTNGWEVCIPLHGVATLSGFIALGRKRDLDVFSSGDLEILETLGAEAAVALENARLYEELRRSQEIIRRADRLSALGTLAAGIAHEIRNPLVSIQTFFQLAPSRINDREFVDSFLPVAAGEVKRISNLVNELLSFARSPAPALNSVSLSDVIVRVATLLEPEARKSRLSIVHDCDIDTPSVYADLDKLKQVFVNLVLNAIEASPPDSVVTIRTCAVVNRGVLCGRAEVLDQGRGIPADQLDLVFTPFYTTKAKGTGLGLAIAHQIVREHGGVVRAEPLPKGVKFVVDIPADSIASGAIAAQEQSLAT